MSAVTRHRLALALGDPHGIGPEIAVKALAALSASDLDRITVYGPRQALVQASELCNLSGLPDRLRHVEVGTLPGHIRYGTIDAAAGRSAVASAEAALRACRHGEADAVVACPHHETAIAQAGIAFSGYPSLVARVCELPEDQVFLMLVGGGLRIVHATLHESVNTALHRLTPELVQQAALAGIRACRMLGIENPRVGLFGVNPHASEGTLFGPEDEAVTFPAASALRATGHTIDGPAGADALLAQRRHDLYVAIFHDQGHIPVKLIAPNAASALSIGGDVLLSSVGHGSAMDIAGRGLADPVALSRTISLLSTFNSCTDS
jgi:4-hydroxythreonine-4-phosphate dehydrogenase/1,2-dihydroxy-3,5-cyclohexadiene-1,4-dicarboxylate dehydrogenase